MTMQRDDLDPIDIHVGAQLKALRATARLTQAELAGALGVTFQQVQKYEKGVNRMAASTLARAAAARTPPPGGARGTPVPRGSGRPRRAGAGARRAVAS